MGTQVSQIGNLPNNLILNGNFDFFQRATSATYNSASTGSYVSDRICNIGGGPTNKNYSSQQIADVPTPAQSNFSSVYSLKHTQISSASFSAGDYLRPFEYRMEGYDYQQIHGGQEITFSFWFKASISGTYPVALFNQDSSRSYVSTFNYSSAGLWQQIFVNLQTDNSGTWHFDNTIGMFIVIGAMTGSTYQTSTLNQWQSGAYYSVPGIANILGTPSSTMQIAQIYLSVGYRSAIGFRRSGLTVGHELELCQRYYEKSYDISVLPGTTSNFNGMYSSICYNGSDTTDWGSMLKFKVRKRQAPSFNGYSPGNGVQNQWWDISSNAANGNLSVAFVFETGVAHLFNSSGTWTAGHAIATQWTADAEL